ncbi:MAG TPA: sigma-70 family RNA polymerase sigma factor [Verrucomicrobiae bacterium]|nr:sigma-70 family RNA polymerase sigma factor [Verrucomicrobiae bacterium]
MNDWELVSAYVHGDEHAFESLVQKYFPMVYSAAVRQVNDRGLAEEIAQSVFILFSRKGAKLSSDVLLSGWFLRTTRFVARDALKQMNRRQKREQQAAALAALTRDDEPGWAALTVVDEALLALSGQEQACVVSRFILGRSFREIGDEFRITEDTAQKRVSRSLDKMRNFLERRGLKLGATSIASLLSVDLSGGAEPALIETALSAVKAAANGNAAAGGSAALADAAAHALLWRSLAKLLLSMMAGAVLVGGGGFVLLTQLEPAVPARPPFQLTDTRIEALGSAWSRAAVMAARLVRGYPQGPPPAGDSRAVVYQRDFTFLNQESNRILAELATVLAGRPDPIQWRMLAELLTVELRENVGLTRRQQAAVFAFLQQEIRLAAVGQGGIAQLQRDRATVGPKIRPWLSGHQQEQFDYVYGEDCRGLFALLTFIQ